ncbi:hypothetical protein MTR_4g070610 [Medicago truncatula]|uniref:Uncharacterized protein n=1 Tax=Medicago truncatula TaxID=3880 RepID=G7JHE6_MEDTR|nr:hypothetical protein MTR_4g070610 [Medicago truncatula]
MRMLESCRLTSLNCPIQSKTIVAVRRLFVPPNYNNCLTFEWGKFKLAKQQDSNIRPAFPMSQCSVPNDDLLAESSC